MFARTACIAGTLAALAGCETPPGIAGCGEIPCGSERAISLSFQESVNRQLDLLFVVDDTPAIAPSVERLAESFPAFASFLADLPGPEMSLHTRIVPATLPGTTCSAQRSREGRCGLYPNKFVRTGDCAPGVNFTGATDEAFRCLADFGAAGCGPLQPLEAMRRALTDGPAGFLRYDADLMVVIVAGADDASLQFAEVAPVASYVDFLRSLKPNPSNQLLVSVVGPRPPEGAAVSASDAPRLLEFVSAFRRGGVYLSLGDPNLLAAFQRLEDRTPLHGAPRCVAGVQDTDAARPGLQPVCDVVERTAEAGSWGPPATLPSCEDAAPPCWRLTVDTTLCPGRAELTVERGADWCRRESITTSLSCLGCVDPRDPACAAP